MSIAELREKIHTYVSFADDKKLKAMYELMKNEIDSKSDVWENKDFLLTLNQRIAEYKKGTVKLISLKDAEERATNALKKIKHSK